MTLGVSRAVRENLKRIEDLTGDRVDDWLWDVADQAIRDWTDEDGNLDEAAAIEEVENDTEIYLDFIREVYPEEIKS